MYCSLSYRTRRRSLRGPHDPLQRRAHTPAPPAPPRQTTSACRHAAADRAGRRVLVLVLDLLIALRLGSGLAGGGGGGRGEGLEVVAEPDAQPAYFRRRRRWRDARPGRLTAPLDATNTKTRASEPRLNPVMWILVHVHITVL